MFHKIILGRVLRYSGADIAVVCREALLRPIRRLGSATHFKRVYIDLLFLLSFICMIDVKVNNLSSDSPRQLWLPCSPGDPEAVELTLDQIQPEELCEPPVTIVSVGKKFI